MLLSTVNAGELSTSPSTARESAGLWAGVAHFSAARRALRLAHVDRVWIAFSYAAPRVVTPAQLLVYRPEVVLHLSRRQDRVEFAIASFVRPCRTTSTRSSLGTAGCAGPRDPPACSASRPPPPAPQFVAVPKVAVPLCRVRRLDVSLPRRHGVLGNCFSSVWIVPRRNSAPDASGRASARGCIAGRRGP